MGALNDTGSPVRLVALAVVFGLLGAPVGAAAAATFDLAQVLDALKRELAAAQTAGKTRAKGKLSRGCASTRRRWTST